MSRLDDKVSIITGSSSGLGRAIALAYAREGAKVVCADLQPEARAEIATETQITTHELIQQGGGKAIFVRTDVGSAKDWEEMIAETIGIYGRVDVLVNNAGIAMESKNPGRIHECTEAQFDTTMRVNAKSVFLGCKYAIGQMLVQEPHTSGHRGWIINMSSIFGIVGGPRTPSYAASKGAVSLLTKQIANDYGQDKIHCNAICPGYTNTAIQANTEKNTGASKAYFDERQPLGGLGDPDDVAGAAVFLASDEARWMTGALMSVDGGYTAR